MAFNQFTGKHANAFFAKETTWGTAVTPDTDFGIVQNITENMVNNLQTLHGLGTRATQFIEAGNFDTNGTVEFLIQHGRFLELLIGDLGSTNTPEVTTALDTVHKWASTHSNISGNIVPFTLDHSFNNTADVLHQIEGCLLTSGTISMDLAGVLKFRGDWVGQKPTTSTTANATASDNLAVLPSFMATLTTGADASETTVTRVQNFELTINNNVQRLYGLGNREAQDGVDNNQEIEFRFTAGFGDDTEIAKLLNGTTPGTITTDTIPSVILTVTNSVALGSGLRKLLLDFADCRFERVGVTSRIGDFVFQDFVGKAIAITNIEFTDDVATY